MTRIIKLLAAFLLACLVMILSTPVSQAAMPPAKMALNVPYLSQHYSVPVGFDDSRGCGITSAAMVLAYYGRIPPYSITGADGKTTAYGWYTTRPYRYKSSYHDVRWTYFASQEHRLGLQGWGAWGFIWRNGTDKTLSDLLPFLKAHDLTGTFIRQPSKEDAQQLVVQEISAGRPIIANSDIIGGHYVVIYGYDSVGEEFKYLVNDPWFGKMSYTYEELKISQTYRGLLLIRPTNSFVARVPYSPGMTATRSYVSPLVVTASQAAFVYQIPVLVPDKSTPTVTLYIDGKPAIMKLTEGFAYNGIYSFTATLNTGVHEYYFSIATPHYTVWFPPDAGAWPELALAQFNGPFVATQPATATMIQMQVMNDKYLVNGKPYYMDMPPIVKNSRTLLPARYVTEPMGAKLQWNPQLEKVTIVSANSATTVEIWIGKNYALVNGVKRYIDSANPEVKPLLVKGRTMLPVRFIAETLGAQVQWDGATKVVTMHTTK